MGEATKKSVPEIGPPSDFRKKYEATEAYNRVNATAPFLPDANKTLDNLKRAGFPNEPEKQDYFKAKILTSMKVHLKQGESIESLWKYLESQYCQTAAIIEGLLRFFAGKVGENEINISSFLKEDISAQPTIEKFHNTERMAQIENTKTELSALLAEIQGTNPTIPPPLISSVS